VRSTRKSKGAELARNPSFSARRRAVPPWTTGVAPYGDHTERLSSATGYGPSAHASQTAKRAAPLGAVGLHQPEHVSLHRLRIRPDRVDVPAELPGSPRVRYRGLDRCGALFHDDPRSSVLAESEGHWNIH